MSSDEEALKLMNDSPYGLTASIWTNAENNPKSYEAFLKLVDQLETGTVFLNRLLVSPLCLRFFLTQFCSCDYLDPALAWVGVKNSGRGVSLSKFGVCDVIMSLRFGHLQLEGFDQLTRPKSVHMKIKTS